MSKSDLLAIAYSDLDGALNVLVKRSSFGPLPRIKEAAPEWIPDPLKGTYDTSANWLQKNVAEPVYTGVANAGLDKAWGNAKDYVGSNPWAQYGLYGLGIGGGLGLLIGLMRHKRKERALSDALMGALLGGGLGGLYGKFAPGPSAPETPPPGPTAAEVSARGTPPAAGKAPTVPQVSTEGGDTARAVANQDQHLKDQMAIVREHMPPERAAEIQGKLDAWQKVQDMKGANPETVKGLRDQYQTAIFNAGKELGDIEGDFNAPNIKSLMSAGVIKPPDTAETGLLGNQGLRRAGEAIPAGLLAGAGAEAAWKGLGKGVNTAAYNIKNNPGNIIRRAADTLINAPPGKGYSSEAKALLGNDEFKRLIVQHGGDPANLQSEATKRALRYLKSNAGTLEDKGARILYDSPQNVQSYLQKALGGPINSMEDLKRIPGATSKVPRVGPAPAATALPTATVASPEAEVAQMLSGTPAPSAIPSPATVVKKPSFMSRIANKVLPETRDVGTFGTYAGEAKNISGPRLAGRLIKSLPGLEKEVEAGTSMMRGFPKPVKALAYAAVPGVYAYQHFKHPGQYLTPLESGSHLLGLKPRTGLFGQRPDLEATQQIPQNLAGLKPPLLEE